MFNTNMDSLFDDSSIYQLVDTDTNGSLGHVENDSGTSVVTLVRHTLVDGRVGKNINVVTDLDVHQVLREMDGTMLAMFLREHVARTRPDTK